MRIVLTKDHAVHARTLPEGSQLRVSNKLGKELIDLKVAKALDGFTFEEQIEHIVEVAMDNEEKPKVKKVTKKKKSNN
jgi:hypothetical protein